MRRIPGVVSLVAAALILVGGIAFAERESQSSFVYAGNPGGMITDNGQLQWQFPAGAYDGDLKITYTPKRKGTFPGDANTYKDLFLVGEPFNVDINIRDSGEGIDTTNNYTMTIKYDPAELSGRPESWLKISRFDGAYQQWWSLPTTVDTVNHTVTAENNEPGDYSVTCTREAPALPEEETATPTPSAESTPDTNPTIPMSSRIGGKLFYDKEGNGVMDGEDFPIGGATVRISSGTWSATTVTDPNGDYEFRELRESGYSLEPVVGPEWAFTTTNPAVDVMVNGQSDSRGTASFGMWYKLPE